jgi:uncharacterized protein YfaS (alpha-2-macroglobulin family)
MRALPTLLSLVFLCTLSPGALAQVTVESFSPTGVVKQVRQATARFSGQVVPLGDLGLADPFVVDCPAKGRGRWIDGRTWSYDFEQDLPAGMRCSFTLKPGQADLAKKPLAGQARFDFSTGGPAIVEMVPREGSDIDERQVFVLGLDAPATAASISSHVHCRAEGIHEKIGVRMLSSDEIKQVLAARKSFVDRYLRAHGRTRAKPGDLAVLQCRRTLPANAKVSLVWDAGVATPNGIASTEAQTLAFRTRPDFTARLHCDRMSLRGACIPFLPMRLSFTAPIALQDAKAIVLEAPGGKSWRATVGKDEEKATHVSQVSFAGPFPAQTRMALKLPAGLKDDAGRALLNAGHFPLTVATGEQPPLVKFPARFGILEARGDRMLPVTLRNVEASLASRMRTIGSTLRVADNQDKQVIDWLQRRTHGYGGWSMDDLWTEQLKKSVFAGIKDGGIEQFALPKPNGRRAFEVIGIPLRKPGFYVVELASPKLGAALIEPGATAYVHTAALVTNLAAHFKHGAESSLVWVTSLDKGRPVAKAQVAVSNCAGAVLWKGVTDASGVARIGVELPTSNCPSNSHGYFVSARKGGDFTFTLSDWKDGIESWRFNLPSGSREADNTMAATVFDRTLLRAGETVHMKHFLRKHTAAGIAFVGASDKVSPERESWRTGELGANLGAQPEKLFVIHQGSDEKFEFPLAWRGGAAETDWAIPAAVKLGQYDVIIGGHLAGSFRVEQFRVPAMKAVLSGPKQPSVGVASVDLDMQLSYLSGGGAALAPVKLRAVVQDKAISFAGYEEFSFGGDIKEGIEKDSGVFDDDEGTWNEAGTDDPAQGPAGSAIRTRNLRLDKSGGLRVVLDQLPALSAPKDLLAELSYQDPNGETMSAATRIPLWSSGYVIGLKPDDWVLSKDKLKFQAVVLDVAGKPAAGVAVGVDFFQRVTYSHRRRLIGGFYAYENSSEVKRLGQACQGTTNAQGLLLCEVQAPADGNLILRASAADAAGRAASAHRDVWVAGSDDWWFKASDNDRIDLLPSKKRYEPGETASFQVRSPFREATALVTVEREGIIDTYVQHLSGTSPVLTIPVKGSYAPNVFVSALVVRGRVAGVQPTALVDLGKPAYKLGIAAMRVGWKAHELKVQVEADKTVYKVRDRAGVKVRVARADGSKPPAGSEVALAAVDLGLLELMPNTSWGLLEAMMQERSLQVETSTAQMQVIGKRHFGRKAFPHGGGGGRSGSRELFDTLLFWKARVALDANGEASVQVPLNDSLTGFRIVAIASGGADLFGTGSTDIRSSQDLMLLSGLPALTREGDRLRAGFTLRNASAGALQVDLGASVKADGGAAQALARQQVTLAPGEARELGWDYQVPVSARSLVWEVDAGLDRLRVTQKVIAAVPVRTQQATLVQLDQPLTIKVQAPAAALPGRGGVLTSFSARLGGELPGVREYMLAYPYTCTEQKTSRAVALRDPAMWASVAASLPAHLDSDGLLKYFASQLEGSDSLTAYVLSVTQEAGYAIAPQTRARMEEGLLAFVQGRIVRNSELATADVAVRKVAALEALSRSGRVTPDALESFTAEPNLWPTSAVIDWYLIMQRTPDLPRRDEQLAQAGKILRARLNLQGTTMGFSTERSDGWWWLMASADVNANRLLLAMLDNPAWKADMGQLARGAIGRQHKGRWDTTLANAWGVLAIEKFSKAFESAPVTGSTSVVLGPNGKQSDWAARGTSGSLMHPWPAAAQDLTLRHLGGGKPWATVQSLAAVPLTAPVSTGYRIKKTITPVEQKVKGAWSRGDIYRVRLELDAQSDMTWVVVDDPIPASATVLGSGLGGDSQVMRSGERQRGWTRPVFEERSFDAFRAYYSYVPKGTWSVEYTVRLNNAGTFGLPATRVEAMYSPEMFGESPNARLAVGP